MGTLLRLAPLLALTLACAAEAPVVSPQEGSALGGDPLRIEGRGFAGRAPIAVYVCERAAKAVVIESDRLIRLRTPPADAPGPCDLRIRFGEAEEIVVHGAFTYLEAETAGAIDFLSPRRGE